MKCKSCGVEIDNRTRCPSCLCKQDDVYLLIDFDSYGHSSGTLEHIIEKYGDDFEAHYKDDETVSIFDSNFNEVKLECRVTWEVSE